jgi:RNA polymerase sigma-70 factor (ECF subfamily)
MKPTAQPADVGDEDLAARRDLVALHDRYARRLPPFLAGLGVPQGDLDDVQQEVWLRVWNQLQGPGTFQGHFRGWLFQIARNLAIDHARRKRAGALPEGPLAAATAAPPEALSRQEEEQRLRHCLDRLPGPQAEVVRGRLGGEEYAQISQRLGVATDRAYRLYHDACKALASCMERARS